MKTPRKIETAAWTIVVATILIWSALYFLDGNSKKAFMGALTIMTLIVTFIWQTKSSHPLPSYFITMIYGFIFLSIGLGTFGGGYSIHHFDDALHLFSGVWTGYGGWLIMKTMLGEETTKQLPKAFIGLYVIAFALAISGLWELLEFAGDKLFHFTAQGRDPDDTMFDMMDGLIGGIVVAIFLMKTHRKGEEKSR